MPKTDAGPTQGHFSYAGEGTTKARALEQLGDNRPAGASQFQRRILDRLESFVDDVLRIAAASPELEGVHVAVEADVDNPAEFALTVGIAVEPAEDED